MPKKPKRRTILRSLIRVNDALDRAFAAPDKAADLVAAAGEARAVERRLRAAYGLPPLPRPALPGSPEAVEAHGLPGDVGPVS